MKDSRIVAHLEHNNSNFIAPKLMYPPTPSPTTNMLHSTFEHAPTNPTYMFPLPHTQILGPAFPHKTHSLSPEEFIGINVSSQLVAYFTQ